MPDELDNDLMRRLDDFIVVPKDIAEGAPVVLEDLSVEHLPNILLPLPLG